MRQVTDEEARYIYWEERGKLKTDERIRRQCRRNRERRQRWTLAGVAVWALVFGVLLGMILGINMMTGGI